MQASDRERRDGRADFIGFDQKPFASKRYPADSVHQTQELLAIR
jgi:hypothetical protein